MFPQHSIGRGARDDRLPGSETLLTSTVPAPIVAVVEAAGSHLTSLRAVQSSWWPAKQLTVRFQATAKDGTLDGRHQIVATAGRIPDGAALVQGPDGDVGIWVVPNDPWLPGLAPALDRDTVSRLTKELGAECPIKSLRFRSYRPGRRGVVEATGPSCKIFLKVVRPGSARSLHEKHRHLAAVMTVPDSLGYSADLGVVILPAMPGADLRRVLREGGEPLPDPESVAAIIDRLPIPRDEKVSKSPIEKLPGVVDLLSRIQPSQSARLAELAEAIGSDDQTPGVPVHGDFYEAQVLVKEGRPAGLIDVDTFGWGRPGDDPAVMLGHLTLLASSALNPARVLAYASRLQMLWESRHDPVDLRRRIAAVVLGQATGPFRVQRPAWPAEVEERIDVAERWVEKSQRADEKSLIVSSGRSHDAHRSLDY